MSFCFIPPSSAARVPRIRAAGKFCGAVRPFCRVQASGQAAERAGSPSQKRSQPPLGNAETGGPRRPSAYSFAIYR